MLPSPPKSYSQTWSRICAFDSTRRGLRSRKRSSLNSVGVSSTRWPARRTSKVSSSSSRSSKASRPEARLAVGAAQHGVDAGDQLPEAERLGQVVVAAEGQAPDLVLDGVAGGQEEHRACAGPTPRGAAARRSRRGRAASRRARPGGGGCPPPRRARPGRSRPSPPRTPRSAATVVTSSRMAGSSSTTRIRGAARRSAIVLQLSRLATGQSTGRLICLGPSWAFPVTVGRSLHRDRR